MHDKGGRKICEICAPDEDGSYLPVACLLILHELLHVNSNAYYGMLRLYMKFGGHLRRLSRKTKK